MIILLSTFLAALVIAWISIPSIIKVATQKHLYDEPNERKAHLSKVPTLGGVAIFAGLIIASTFFLKPDTNVHFGAIFSATIILFFTGIKDDIIPLPPFKKMLAQLVAAAIVVFQGGVKLTSFYGFFNIYDVPEWLGIIVSIFTIIVIINSFNLIDGINGLAGGISFIVCATFGIWFYLNDYDNLAIVSVATCGSLIGFLRYNLVNARVFMGDTGSLIIGLISAVLSIEFIELGQKTVELKGGIAPIFAVAILIIPLFDTLRVFIIRALKGQSPFSGDRNHLHHALLDIGYPHAKASLVMYGINVLFIILAYILKNINPLYFLTIIISTALMLSTFLSLIKIKTDKKNGQKKVMQAILSTKKSNVA